MGKEGCIFSILLCFLRNLQLFPCSNGYKHIKFGLAKVFQRNFPIHLRF